MVGFRPLRQIAYMKQRRGSGAKVDKAAAGLGLGAWPNMGKKDLDSAKVSPGVAGVPLALRVRGAV